MNRDEAQAAIERLGAIPDGDAGVYSVSEAFMGKGQWSCCGYRNKLIALLSASLGSIQLPRDADDVPIRINDDMVCVNDSTRIVVKRLKYSEKHGWMIGGADHDALSEYGLYSPKALRHYHEPTVDEILDALESMRYTGDYDMVIKECAELAKALRKLLKEEG